MTLLAMGFCMFWLGVYCTLLFVFTVGTGDN